LEEKNRNTNAELEYYQTLSQQMRINKLQIEHDLMAEKDAAVVKAKAETMAQIVKMSSGKPNFAIWQDPFVASDPKLELDPSSGIHHPLLSSATFHV
jgi:hypothetical protein